VVALVGWQGYQPTAQGREVLRSLLHWAHDDLAARALLQALLPRARAERVVTPRFGHGLGENWQLPADTVADLVAECFAAIKRHAGEDRPDVARLVIQEATRKLRTARQAQRRYQERVVPSGPGRAGAAADLFSARTSAEWLAGSLCQAVRAGHLSKADASLLYGARVKGLPASEVGRAAGLAPKAVYHALARAEQALARKAA
jgi:DNA-directed RNA polymerase specialized sigma24 family protein